MKQIMKHKDLANELAARTGFYKKNMEEVVAALSDIIQEHFKLADFDNDSEMHLAPGVVICGRRVHEREAVNPKTQEKVITPEKVIPYVSFKPSIRKKLYERQDK